MPSTSHSGRDHPGRPSSSDVPLEPCPTCESDGVARFAARELEAFLLRNRPHLAPEARAELELLRDALEELLPARGRIIHVSWNELRRAA